MIDNTSENIKLTFEQQQQIAETQKRLSNLENELTLVQKNLVVEKKEVVKATKEREYQEELLAKLVEQVKEKTLENESLEQRSAESKDTLLKIQEEARSLKEKMLNENNKLGARELKIIEKEKENLALNEKLNAERNTQEIDRQGIEKARKLLLEAVKAVSL